MNILTKTLTSMGTFENQEMNYTTTSSLCNVSTCYDYEKDNYN